MKIYSLEELKIAWKELWNSDTSSLWSDINTELAKRLTRDEYAQFVLNR